MGYGEYMKNLLAPLQLYDLEHGAGAGELDVLGQFLDGLFDDFVCIEKESVISTAEDEGLAAYEHILPYVPVSGTTQERRAALCALLSIDGASFSCAEIARTLIGCGISAQAHETDSPEVDHVSEETRRTRRY